jgi:hypothetical protein
MSIRVNLVDYDACQVHSDCVHANERMRSMDYRGYCTRCPMSGCEILDRITRMLSIEPHFSRFRRNFAEIMDLYLCMKPVSD